MSQGVKSEERIIIMVDPFTKEHLILNHTHYPNMEIEGDINAEEDGKGNHIVKIQATFTFKRK